MASSLPRQRDPGQPDSASSWLCRRTWPWSRCRPTAPSSTRSRRDSQGTS